MFVPFDFSNNRTFSPLVKIKVCHLFAPRHFPFPSYFPFRGMCEDRKELKFNNQGEEKLVEKEKSAEI